LVEVLLLHRHHAHAHVVALETRNTPSSKRPPPQQLPPRARPQQADRECVTLSPAA